MTSAGASKIHDAPRRRQMKIRNLLQFANAIQQSGLAGWGRCTELCDYPRHVDLDALAHINVELLGADIDRVDREPFDLVRAPLLLACSSPPPLSSPGSGRGAESWEAGRREERDNAMDAY